MRFVFVCQRPHHDESTGSRPITEVKHHRARSVLGWVTAWEHRVLLTIFFIIFFFRTINFTLSRCRKAPFRYQSLLFQTREIFRNPPPSRQLPNPPAREVPSRDYFGTKRSGGRGGKTKRTTRRLNFLITTDEYPNP